MTVYSVNKRVLEQATNMTQASTKAGGAAADFAALLGNSGARFAAGQMPSAEKVLGKSLERPVREVRETKAADQPERAEAKPVERDSRRGDANATERADKAQPRDKALAKDAKVDSSADQAEATPTDTAATTQTAKDGEQTVTEQPAAQTDTTNVAATTAPTPETQPQVAAATQAMAEVVIDTDGDAGEQDPLAALNRQQAEAGAAGAERNAAAQAGADTTQAGEQSAQQDLAAKAAAKPDSHGQQQNAGASLAAQQADDLAAQLADTGAQLSVQVSVTNAAKTASAVATEAAGPLDILLAQDVAAEFTPAGQQAGSQTGGQGGNQNQGVANAAQQVAANAAEANAQAAAGKAAEAKPFLAALAAQMEAGPQTQSPSGQGQQTQAVAGLNGMTGTQAATKPAPTQAAHAPRQPQATPEQVMDQVAVQITKQAKDGHDTIKVQLKPVELGSIEVKLDIAQDGRVTGVVTADNKDTLAMLQKDSRGLEKALEDAGLKADGGSLSFSLREGNQQANEGNTQGRSRRARAMAAGLDGTAGLGGAAQAQPRWSGNRSGVDIKV